MMIDEYHLQLDSDMNIEKLFNLTELFIGGNNNENFEKFYGCLKDITFVVNDTLTYPISDHFLNKQINQNSLRCSSLLSPIEFLISSSYISF
ncbi:unnamed protein product, partial [Rotaria socialis]